MVSGFMYVNCTSPLVTLSTRLSTHRQVAAIFIDVKKAFDSVLHIHLISSLAGIGISGPLLLWLSDYLTGRQQRAVLNGTVSHPTAVTSGVPQGSILGPLLFNIHMNSISSLPLSQNARLILYADDILFYKPVNSAADVSHLQQDVNLLLSWMDAHGLTPKHSKTQLLPITRTKRPFPNNIFMGSHPIPPCKSVKYLSWCNHLIKPHLV